MEERRNMFATDEQSLKQDTKVTFFRSASGPGGQNVNKRETGVRLRHVPSGIIVEASRERYQGQNRSIAFERLKERLEALNKPRKQRKLRTKPSRAAKEKRLKAKRELSQKKQFRQTSSFEL